MILSDYSVLIVYNQPAPGAPESETGVLVEVEAVAAALDRLGVRHRKAGLRRLEDLAGVLAVTQEPVVFNLVEGFPGRPADANLVPAICQGFGKGCTGNSTAALTLGLDKWTSKGILANAGLPCPGGVVIPPGAPIPFDRLPQGTVIVKPMATDASEGIEEDGVMDAAATARLEAAVRRLHEQFRHPVLVEPFVGERELNVSVIRTAAGGVQVLPLAEIDFSAFANGKPRLVGYAAKWLPESFEYNHTPRVIPAPLPDVVAEAVRRCARDAWDALGLQDYARVDFRLAADGSPFILEANPNPDISPDAGFAAALEAAGIPYERFVGAMVENAVERLYGRILPATTEAPEPARQPAKTAGPGPAIEIRYTLASDRDAIVALVRDTKFFRDDEVDVAAEVVDEAIAKGPEGHYQSFTALVDGSVAGWVCHGPTPCTIGTYDIYWLAVAPAVQGCGLGRKLMAYAEEHIRSRGGRLAVVETAGKAIYDSTRAFYLRVGYQEAARLPEFYSPGDDKIIYLKRLA